MIEPIRHASEENAALAGAVCLTEARRRFPQTRAIEIALPAGFEADEGQRLLWLVQRAGFNTILLSCFRHGSTLYPSPVMKSYGFPSCDGHLDGGKAMLAVLEAARGVGVTVYALVESLYVGGPKGRRGPILRRRPEWATRSRQGTRRRGDPPFLCPANRDVGRFLGDLFCEIMEGFGFQGLYLRHLHYPLECGPVRADYCCCESCRRAVWRSLGVRVEQIPDDPEHPDRYNLTSWRVKQLARLIRSLRLRTAKAAGLTVMIAEVYLGEGEPAAECCGFQLAGQWARDNLLPTAAFRPLPPTRADSEAWIKRAADIAQCALVMPVLSAEPGGPLLGALTRLAHEPIAGVVVCEPHDLTAPPLAGLAQGPWREPTQVAEQNPLVSVCALLTATTQRLAEGNPVRAFLTDAARVLGPLGESWPLAQIKTLHDNLFGLEERIADGRLDVGDAAAEVLRNFRLTRQLLHLMEMES